MRFPAEQADPENAGLGKARSLLEPIKQKHPWISYADLYILAGYVAIEVSGGPFVPFAYGRVDFTQEQANKIFGQDHGGCPFGHGKLNPNGSRLPNADLGPACDAPPNASMAAKEKPSIDHVRSTFRRMGFDDRETVLLIVLGHQYGRCHPDVSGYEDAWYAFDPAHWNVYEGGLGYLSIYEMHTRAGFREVETAKGKRQYSANLMGGKWMLLITDLVLWWDPDFKKWIQHYDRRRADFKRDAIAAWIKLTQLGVPEGQLVQESTPVPAPAKSHSYY